ncbi:BIRC7_8 [Mytilus coruscus]|uniref:BIRC7_8 n=1 Tax=Mytilus coruscus TaxID=42192 RepID=A0A6J8AZ62_MYTCO|nr:BIRC7_8 [Mytilus coruscus]
MADVKTCYGPFLNCRLNILNFILRNKNPQTQVKCKWDKAKYISNAVEDISTHRKSDPYSKVDKQDERFKRLFWQKKNKRKKKKTFQCLGKSNLDIIIMSTLGHDRLECRSHKADTEFKNPILQNKKKALTLIKRLFKCTSTESNAKFNDYDFEGTAQCNNDITEQCHDNEDCGVSTKSPIVTSVTVHIENENKVGQFVTLESGPLCNYKEQQCESEEITPQSSRNQEVTIIKCSSSLESLQPLDECLNEKSSIDDEQISILREEHTDVSSCNTCDEIISLQRNLPPDNCDNHNPVNSDSTSDILTCSTFSSIKTEYDEADSANLSISLSDDSLNDEKKYAPSCPESVFQNIHPNQDQDKNECKTLDTGVNCAKFDKVAETVKANNIHMIYDSKTCLDHKCATCIKCKKYFAKCDFQIHLKDKEAHANDKDRETAVSEIAPDLNKNSQETAVSEITLDLNKNKDVYEEVGIDEINNASNSKIFTTRKDTIQVKVDEGTDFTKEDINEDKNTELKAVEAIKEMEEEYIGHVRSDMSKVDTGEDKKDLKNITVETLEKCIFPSFLMFGSTILSFLSDDTHPDRTSYIKSKICGTNTQQKYPEIKSYAFCLQLISNPSCLLQTNGIKDDYYYSIHQTEKCKIWDATDVLEYNKTIVEAVEKQIASENETTINHYLIDGFETDKKHFEPSLKDLDNRGQIRLGHTSVSINMDLEEFMRYMNSSTKPHHTNKEMSQRLKQLLRKLVVKTKIKSAKSPGTSKKKRIYKHTKRLTIEQLMKKFFNEMNAQFPNKGMDPSTKSLYDQIFKYLPFKHEQKLQVYPIHGLKQYFEEMSVPVSSRPAHAETMKFEWVRVRSFWSFPSNIRVSPIAMARVGFYYTGKCAECRCFCCGKVYREWRDGDDPYLIHQQISPTCFYLNGRESGNVPIHEEDRLKPRHIVEQTLYSANAPADNAQAGALPGLTNSELSQIPVPQIPVTQERPFGSSQSGDFTFRPPESTQSGPASQQPVINPPLPGYFSQTQQTSQNANQTTPASLPSVQQGSTSVQNVSPTPQGSGPSSQQNQPETQTSITVREQSGEVSRQTSVGSGTIAGSQESASATVSRGPSIQPPATVATASGKTSTTSSSISQPPPATTTSTTGTTGGSSSSTAVTEPSRSRFDPLGINFEKPRYPAYAVLTVRINTYNGWPNYLDQTPRVMATAGFFYAGYGDYTRCFFCGGGLRNWEAGDDPWVEHARWFPKCAFLRQNKGDNYVRMVQTRHQEAEASNQPIQLPRQLSVLDEGRPTNIMSSIPVQTLREMGKDDTIINQAIDRWRSNRQQTGRSHDNAELQATEIYEVILQIEEEREQGASALPTIGQQLALTQPRNQVVPQTSVAIAEETTEEPTGAEGTTDDLSYMEGFEKVLEEYEEQKEKLTCTICMENPVAIAFLPCGHLEPSKLSFLDVVNVAYMQANPKWFQDLKMFQGLFREMRYQMIYSYFPAGN